ncbi:MAG TPA: hypothetical protein VHO24_01405 [Opitutaceae bacterium]|nr:hypothetical protein [Opitutaceae bacterium]
MAEEKIAGHPTRRLLIAAAVMAIIAVRKHDTFLNPQFWAEDGKVFFMQAEAMDWRVLFRPYEGYLHFLPRLIAAIGRGLPLYSVPVFYAATALLFTGLIAWTIQSPRIRVPAAWAGALAIAIIPHSGEVYLTICNLHWISAIGLFALVLMDDPATLPRRCGEIALLVIAGLTGPFVVLALPFFGWRAWRRRNRWSYLLLAVAVAATAAHVPSLLNRPAVEIAAAWDPVNLAAVIGRRLWVSLFAGQISVSRAVSVLLAIAIPVGLGWGLWRQKSAREGWLLLAGALAVLAAASFKARIDTWNHTDLVSGGRYFFAAKVLGLWAIAALLPAGTAAGRVLGAALLILPVAANYSRFIYPRFPDQRWAFYAGEIKKHHPVTVPILPDGFSFSHPGRPAR